MNSVFMRNFVWLLCCFTTVACSSMPNNRSSDPPQLTPKIALSALEKQLSQPYSIYKYRRRFRVDSDQQQLTKNRYIVQLEADSRNGFVRYTQSSGNEYDYVSVESSGFRPSIPVYALNLFGFAFPDGERNIESITSIENNVVSFQLRLQPGIILKSRGFRDNTKSYSGRAKLEYSQEKSQYEIIKFEQFAGKTQQWKKLGFEVENGGKTSVFFIDPDTELLYEFLSKHDTASQRYKAMLPYQKYISPIELQ